MRAEQSADLKCRAVSDGDGTGDRVTDRKMAVNYGTGKDGGQGHLRLSGRTCGGSLPGARHADAGWLLTPSLALYTMAPRRKESRTPIYKGLECHWISVDGDEEWLYNGAQCAMMLHL
jgi:hypothetical protein